MEESNVDDNYQTVVYDARNLRVRKVTPAMATVFHYDINGRLIAETDAAGATLVEYVYLDDTPLATIRPTDTVYYYHTDHLGTPRVMTNSSGTVAWRAAFHAFGYGEVDASSTITDNLRFPGQYFDAETNLHYNWNRYYDPRTGRYLTPDPIGLEGGIDPYVYVDTVGKPLRNEPNLFVYTNNNPVNYIDAEGLQAHQGFIILIRKMSNKSLLRTIKSLNKQIEKHERKLADKCQTQARRHHQHEIDVFKNQLRLTEEEAARRRLLGMGLPSELITEEQAQRNTGGWLLDLLDPIGNFLWGAGYAY